MLLACPADDGARYELSHPANPQLTSQQGQFEQQAQLLQTRSAQREAAAALVNVLAAH
jgi:hypothetical protein